MKKDIFEKHIFPWKNKTIFITSSNGKKILAQFFWATLWRNNQVRITLYINYILYTYINNWTTFLLFDNLVIQEQTTLYHAPGHQIVRFVYNFLSTHSQWRRQWGDVGVSSPNWLFSMLISLTVYDNNEKKRIEFKYGFFFIPPTFDKLCLRHCQQCCKLYEYSNEIHSFTINGLFNFLPVFIVTYTRLL